MAWDEWYETTQRWLQQQLISADARLLELQKNTITPRRKVEDKSLKPELLKFDGWGGPEEFKEWVLAAEKFFEYEGLDVELAWMHAIMAFEERANYWYEDLKRARERKGKTKIRTWSKLKKHLQRRFLPKEDVELMTRVHTASIFQAPIQTMQNCEELGEQEVDVQEVTTPSLELETVHRGVQEHEHEPSEVASAQGCNNDLDNSISEDELEESKEQWCETSISIWSTPKEVHKPLMEERIHKVGLKRKGVDVFNGLKKSRHGGVLLYLLDDELEDLRTNLFQGGEIDAGAWVSNSPRLGTTHEWSKQESKGSKPKVRVKTYVPKVQNKLRERQRTSLSEKWTWAWAKRPNPILSCKGRF